MVRQVDAVFAGADMSHHMTLDGTDESSFLCIF